MGNTPAAPTHTVTVWLDQNKDTSKPHWIGKITEGLKLNVFQQNNAYGIAYNCTIPSNCDANQINIFDAFSSCFSNQDIYLHRFDNHYYDLSSYTINCDHDFYINTSQNTCETNKTLTSFGTTSGLIEVIVKFSYGENDNSHHNTIDCSKTFSLSNTLASPTLEKIWKWTLDSSVTKLCGQTVSVRSRIQNTGGSCLTDDKSQLLDISWKTKTLSEYMKNYADKSNVTFGLNLAATEGAWE